MWVYNYLKYQFSGISYKTTIPAWMFAVFFYPFYVFGISYRYTLLPVFYILLILKLTSFISISWYLVFTPLILTVICLLIVEKIKNF